MNRLIKKWRGMAAGLLASLIVSFHFFPFIALANEVDGFNLNVEGFNLDVEGFDLDVGPYEMNEVTPFNLEVDPFNLEVSPFTPGQQGNTSNPSTGNGGSGLNGNVGPVLPIQLPDGTVLLPQPDGTFTPANPNSPYLPGNPSLGNLPGNQNPFNPNSPIANNSALNPGGNGKPEESSENEGISGLDAAKYVINDVAGTTVVYAGTMDAALREMDPNSAAFNRHLINTTVGFKAGLLTGGYKMAVKGTSIEWTADLYDVGEKGVMSAQSAYALGKFSAGKIAAATGRSASFASTAFQPVSKLNAGVAAVGAVTSGIEAGTKWYAAYNAETDAERNQAMGEFFGATGETLMNAGVVAAAIPGGQVIGAGLVVVGGAMWLGSTIYKYRNNISSFLRKSKTVSKILDSKPVKAVKDAAKGAWDWTKKTFFGG